ncbi:cytosolic carboxypeptidase 6 [Aricia agestis]|uniref:cytosolic carboxypeptidase 6 n=1 Tax=Aricia agestis TaxID=91739 RepID=UPI001C208D58|nr:cytosolic carboxypeptidase 6 [Aricia agestis]
MEALVDDLDHTSIYWADSEESDGEGGLGNLNRLIVRPPGHSGKAKRGHLCFDAAFECGNLGRADHVSELEYDLYVRPDTCRPRSRFWFNFTVENVKQDQRVIFNIVNLGKEQILYNEGMTPLRIPKRLVFFHRSLAHHNRKILSVAFGFDREDDVYHFAAAPPYSYSRLQKYLSAWEKRAQMFATRECIAQTTQKRKVDLITIGDLHPKEKDLKDDTTAKGKIIENKKRLVMVFARSHGGESPASFICQGLMDFLVSSSEKATALRNVVVIQIVPMINPDGVFLGNHRSDLLGSDLNRCWSSTTVLAHPAIVAINQHVQKVKAEKTLQLDFIIDIHADISHEGVFVRGNSYDDVYRFERHAVLPKFMAMRVEAWQAERCLYNADGNVAGSARRTLPDGTLDAYTLLASMGGRRINGGHYMHYTEDSYMKIGRALGKSLCDYYRHVGVIPPRVSNVKKREPRRRRRHKRRAYERERSPSSSPERRVLAARVLSPRLPAASPPAPRPPRPTRTARTRPLGHTHSVRIDDTLLPAITGKAVTPKLAVVDFSAYIRAPGAYGRHIHTRGPQLARPPRPTHAQYTSDDYDTQETDS